MSRIIVLFFILISIAGRSFAQQKNDSLSVKKDTVLATSALQPAKEISKQAFIADTTPFITPKKIALFSAIVPGLGQYYNKQYWKIGVIYAGVGTAIYFLQDNLKNYNKYRRIYAAWINGDETIKAEEPLLNQNQVKLAQDYYRRNLDLTVLLTGIGYTLQVIDAVVFAHLKGFDISEDISLNARPVLTPQGGLGFGLVMNFK